MGTSVWRRLIVAGVSVLCVVGAADAGAVTLAQRVERAAAFVAANQADDGSFPAFSAIGSTSDAVIAFASAGIGQTQVDDAIVFLRRQTRAGHVSGVGTIGKVVLAVEAAGRDGHAFGGHDLVAEIDGAQLPSGRFAGASVFDQALATLALTAADGGYDLASLSWLLAAQCPDGGWQFDRPYHPSTEGQHCGTAGDPSDYFRSDTNTTALVVSSIAPSGKDAYDHDPFAFFDAIRDTSHGGWGYTWGFDTTDANSTSLVIQAYAADGRDVPSGAGVALRDLQYPCGAFAFSWSATGTRTGRDLGATIGAIQGLLGEPLPVPPAGTLAEAPASSCPA
jgi:hypothetical protein